MATPLTPMEAKCVRGIGAMANLKAIYLHVVLAIEPFLEECNPPAEIKKEFKDMGMSFDRICEFIAKEKHQACQKASQESKKQPTRKKTTKKSTKKASLAKATSKKTVTKRRNKKKFIDGTTTR